MTNDFAQTWTILGAGFNGTFSALDACCTNINSEFQQTWSILGAGFNGTFSVINTINTEANGTFSAIADLKNTMTNDFAQTWTILGAGFNGTFSALNACCTNINSEFQQTWSILAAGFNGTFSVINTINTEANGTFSAIADLKNTMTNDFAQTWTILGAGFNGTFSALNACCTNINSEFQQTWSILNADFNGTFSSIAAISSTNFSYSVITDLKATLSTDFNQTWTILGAGFNGTFSAIAELDADLSGTFSAIAAGFNGTFSALDSDTNNIIFVINGCCNFIASEFQQTWTILADGFNDTFTSIFNIDNEFQQTWTILGAGFNGTFSAIAELDADLSGTFSALNACCTNINSEFQQTWTILAAGFEQTWTILDADFNGTFSTLYALTLCGGTPIVASTTISLPGYYCLANDITGNIVISSDNVVLDLNNHTITNNSSISIDIQGGTNRTIKNGRIDGIGSSSTAIQIERGCNQTQIENIFVSGNNSSSSTGIGFAQTTTNLTINDVTMQNLTFGINLPQQSSLSEKIILNNINLDTITDTGIVIGSSINVIIKNIIIDDCNIGINLPKCTGLRLSKALITTSTQGIIANNGTGYTLKSIEITGAPSPISSSMQPFTLTSLSNATIDHCKTYSTAGIAFNITTCNNIQFTSCFIDDCYGTGSSSIAYGFFMQTNCSDLYFKNCVVQNVIEVRANNVAAGFYTNDSTSTNLEILDCSINNITAAASNSGPGYGYLINGNNISITNCNAQKITSTISYGFSTTGTNIMLTNCFVQTCSTTVALSTGSGILLNTNGGSGLLSAINCQSSNNTNCVGFATDSANITLGNCVAVNNTGNTFCKGFNSSPTAKLFWCFASGNTANYTSGVTAINNVTDQVISYTGLTVTVKTGPYAGSNLFI